MALSTQRMRACLQAFDFRRLFVEELGWNNYTTKIAPTELNGTAYTFAPVAEQGGMVVVTCVAADGNIPPGGIRAKIDKYVTGFAFEHLILFLDRDAQGTPQTSLWYWVRREEGKLRPRTFTYRRGAMGDALLQKLAGIAFAIEDLDEEGSVSIATVTSKVKKAFDVEAVTKKFYDQFKTEHAAFSKFLAGVEDAGARDWYISVMLNRLMFLYFIQKKRFLNDDPDYLQTKLAETQAAGLNFYRDFLLKLFFDGLACEPNERDAATSRLLGTIPYLNGGLFLPHPIEDQYGDQIAIADDAFARLFDFFDAYTWHLDERPLRKGNEINPDVLGYIFEKYINQKQMGAYYTKEDITSYICRSTILPFLLDKCGVDISAILTDVQPYIYEAVATEEYLPTETEREYAARRQRYASIQADFAAGKIASVDDLVTYNLDIQALVEDWLRTLNDPVLLRRFYFECLSKLTVLDPTCGSGAFLFAAMNILEPLYDLALDKMRQIVGAPEAAPALPALRENVVKYLDFVDELKRVSAHPNRAYYVLKRIIVDNLYGVDIMEEAVEICKLRLFLKLVAQVETPAQVEPLPDIDFNIRAGNTLVGFATRGEIEGRLFATPELKRKVEAADRDMHNFRDLQTRVGVESGVFKKAKRDIQAQLSAIRADLDQSLMDDYGLGDLDGFRTSHKPFHWYLEFNSVLANGGFDVIVGNPPYVEYSKVRKEYTLRNYVTERAGNLYTFVMERSFQLQKRSGRYGMIVPISSVCSERTTGLRELVTKLGSAWISTYDIRPSRLFDVGQRLAIWITAGGQISRVFSSRFHHWSSDERINLFSLLHHVDASTVSTTRYFVKVGSPYFTTVLSKLLNPAYVQLGNQVAGKRTENFVFYQESARYWIKAAVGLPFYKKNGVTEAPAHGRTLYFDTRNKAMAAFAVASSTLFYLWFVAVCDGFHVTDDATTGFRLRQGLLSSEDLARLGKQLDDNQRISALRKTMRLRSGTEIEYDEYQAQASKPIIDEIDRVLARHYGFTDEELDFIIHYDIKYRMGKDADAGDDGDEAE